MTHQDERIRNAMEDIARLKEGWRPGEAALAEAVYIENWQLTPVEHGHALIEGISFGHPRIADGRPMHTSVVLYIDAEAGIARTVSRWYRLGRPSPEFAAALEKMKEAQQHPEVETTNLKM